MPRSLVLGNGGLLICLDSHAFLREIYYHYVGLENQMYKGCIARVGVYVDGVFSWLWEQDWNMAIDYRHETMAGNTVAVNEKLQLEINFLDLVYNEKNIFLRKVTIQNKADRKRNIKLFFNHQFHIYESKVGDTAYFDPKDNTIVHYKGRRVVVLGGGKSDDTFSEYSIGLFGIEGKEGSFRDAEDGVLSGNPVEHGSVDSTIGFVKDVEAKSSSSFSLHLVIAKSLSDAKELHSYVLEKGTDHLIETTQDFWNAWVNKLSFNFQGLERRVSDLFKKSLLIIRTHVDNTGAIIASGDSDMLQHGRDTYSYVWPRDASFISLALDMGGYFEVTRHFFEFAAEVISADGYFYHKYRSDKSMGSSWHPWIKDGKPELPIQEDETAIVIFALWRHYEKTKDLEFIENVYNSLIKKAADFMISYRDEKTRLPRPSYDLWEMKYGTSTFTASCVCAALFSAGEFARLLGKEEDEKTYSLAAEEIKEAIIKYLYNEKTNFFHKLVNLKEDGEMLFDETIDISSFWSIFKFGILPVDDERIKKGLSVVLEKLVNPEKTGGVIRFEGDIYYRVHDHAPSNPWFVTTLWLAQYYIEAATGKEDLTVVKKYLTWVVDNALPSGILSEQISPFSNDQISASPLIWSHAEFVSTVVLYLEKMEKLQATESNGGK